MKRYRLRLTRPHNDPLLKRLGLAAGYDEGTGVLAVLLPGRGLVHYARYGTALKDAIACATVARSFDLRLEHPIMLGLGEQYWTDTLGAGLGLMIHGALRGDPGYENLRDAIHAYPQEPTVDERGCTLTISALSSYPGDLPTGGNNPPGFVHDLFKSASKVYGLHGEPLAPDQIRRVLTNHVDLGPMMRRFYETPAQETDSGSGGVDGAESGGV